MEIKEEESKNNNNKSEKANSLRNNNIFYKFNETILKEIFIHKKIGNKIEYKPILINSNTLPEILKKIFVMPDFDVECNKNLFINFANNKIELFNEIKDIIGNSYEIIQIIINYLSKNRIYLINYFIDLYFDFISNNYIDDNEILSKIKCIIIWFFNCGFMNKKYTDYIFQKISIFQHKKKLTPRLFDYCLSLIEIIYGKEYNKSFKQNLIAKNYIYFCNNENSILKTNISKTNNIHIKDSCSLIIWFYIKDDQAIGGKLCNIIVEKEQAPNHITFDFLINENFDIDIKSLDAKGNEYILKEQNNKKFNLKKNEWIQLKIQIMKLGIKLNLFQNYKEIKNSKEKDELINNECTYKIKYETKIYQTNNKKFSNNNDLNFDLNNFNIIDLNFFVNYSGCAGTIIFCKNNNPSEIPINSLYGMKSNKISNFIIELGLSDIFFIFSPSLFIKEKNKFIYLNNNIIGEFSSPISFQEPNTIIEYNYVYQYCNFINNIYKLGGTKNLLPLFEIFYKFTNENKKTDDKDALYNIFYKLIKLIELIVVNKEKNYLEMYYNNNFFFESLELFLENIDEKYYQKNNGILLSLISTGKYIFEYCKKKILSYKNNIYNYFRYILFYPKIVLKFSLEQQNMIWNFFEEIKNSYKKKSKSNKNIENSENYIFQHSYYRTFFLTFEQLNNFILLFNKKYPNDFLSPSLLNIIKNIFFDSATNDNERESLLLLINSNIENQNRLSDKIIISIIEIFIYYLDTNYKKYMSNNTKFTDFLKIDNNKENFFYSPLMSIKNFLSSPNYFIETILNILSMNNLNIKKVMINLLRIISQKYEESLKSHFINVEIDNKKLKKSKRIQRVTKDEFYLFIEENISQNNNNQKIREMRKYDFNDNNIYNNDNQNMIKNIRRKSTMDNIKIIDNNNINEQYKIDNYKKTHKNKKQKHQNSHSCETKEINEIKTKIYNNYDNFLNQRRKTDFNIFDIRFSNLSNLSNPYNLTLKNRVSSDGVEKNKDNDNNKIKDSDKLEIQKTSCEISMILFDWLLTSEKQIINKRSSAGNLSSFSNISFDSISNSYLTDIIINLILKFLCSNKDLEVIYKLLFIIIGQKGFDFVDNKKNIKSNLLSISDNYFKLLNYFSSSKTNFIQFIEELMINSYLSLHVKLANNKFNFIEEPSTTHGVNKDKNECFKVIYEKAKELIIDIYFHEDNLYKNEIIYEIINIILSLSNGLKNKKDLDEENEKTKYILINLLNELFSEIIDIYNIKLDTYKKKLRKKSSKDISTKNSDINANFFENDKKYSNYSEIEKNYLIFLTFIFEQMLLLVNSNNYISNIFTGDSTKIKNFSGFPEFLKYEIDYKGNKKLLKPNIEMYAKVYKNILAMFSIENLIKNITSINIEKEEGQILYLEPKEINKIFKEFSNNKDLKNKLKEKLNFLFLSYNKEEFKDFPLITIITILNNYYINYFINTQTKIENINNDLNIFLDSHMQFILIVILISSFIKENENYLKKEKSYKEIQDIIFADLLYNINSIIFYFDSQYSLNFIEIFTNIISLISYLWTNDNDHKSVFHLGKSKSKNGVKRIITYYISKYTSIFNSSNFELFSKQSIKESKEIIQLETTNLFKNIHHSPSEDKSDNLPNEDIFSVSKYEHIYKTRKYNLNRKLKLLITENCDKNSFESTEEENKKEAYKNILLKVDTLKVIYDNNDIDNNFSDIIKRKNYRKIKKQLYSWNNSFSNKDAFYKNRDLIPTKDEIIIKYKLSNYLSKDMTRKLLVPILDIDYYMPNFKSFKYKEKLFQNNIDNNINQYKNLYKIDLQIFNNKINTPKNEDQKKYIIENVCYIKTTHHIRGKIYLEKNLLPNNDTKNIISLSPPLNSFFFMESNTYSKDYLLNNCEDYDSDHLTCFGSIFINNNNSKDSETFLNFDFNDILFIFYRKYCFRNNAIEIFLSNNRSYYFKFFDTNRRDKFINDLVLIINKNHTKNKIFKQMKGIDENNKATIIGYYKDENNNKEYSSISNIRDIWKISKISTLEYLMWINIYGNRSFRDISQYPVFPWLLTNYEYNTYEELVQNPEIRDFNLPMGMLCVDEKSKKRQEGYIDTYKNMVVELYEQNLVNIKINYEEENTEQNNNKIARNTVVNQNINLINYGNININQRSERNESVIINYQALPNIIEQNESKNLPKIPDYKFDIEKLYNNPNFEYEKIPYCFGSHFSNSMYVSHYLGRIFPYSLTLVEIQGDGFDIADRLFIRIQNSFYTACSEKCDLREIIPEFFTLPEMFLNINSLELGKINILQFIKEYNINNADSENDKKEIKQLNEVMLPVWCKRSPYLFVEKYRKIIESPLININPWIDLVFGFTQRGIKSQRIGNLFLPYTYDGVVNCRIKKEELLKDRGENEYMMRLFEMGVNPCKVFEKKNKILKNKINNQIIDIGSTNPDIVLPEVKLKINNNKKIIYMNCYLNESDELFLLDNNFSGQKINIQETKEIDNYIIKETSIYKELSVRNYIDKNIQNKLIIKTIFKYSFLILTGYFDGSLYLIKTPNKGSKKDEAQKIVEKPYNINEETVIKLFDKSLITSLEIDKDDKYLIYGTLQGSIVIYSLNYNLYKNNKTFIKFHKIFKSHNNSSISSISINTDLNLFADCAYDGYVNIYALCPHTNFSMINSIYIDTSIYNFTLDYIFLSAQPLACVVLYSNDKCQFKCFSINGRNLDSSETDTSLTSNKFNEYYLDNEESMISPVIFTDYMFNDYLIYIFKKNYVLIREFPSMRIIMALNPTRDNIKEELSLLCISNDNKYLYIMEQKNNKIYIVNQKTYFGNAKENKKI